MFIARGSERTSAAPSLSPGLQAAGANQLPVQGVLTDGSGQPLDGTFDVTFSLFANLTGGASLFTESYNGPAALAVGQGLFDVQLGSLTAGGIPSSVSGDPEIFLEVQVGSDLPMAPRLRLGAVPYAINADMLIRPFDSSLSSPNAALSITKTWAGPALQMEGAVRFQGTTGGTPANGAGTRFMSIPAKIGAMRAGLVRGGHWDDVKIGNSSVAFGFNTIASSFASTLGGGANNKAGNSASCGNVLTQDTVLNADLFCSGAALQIQTDGLTLDCAGFSINGQDQGTGIEVRGNNVQVRNCVVRGFTWGISASGNGHLFRENLFEENGTGALSQASNVFWVDNEASNNTVRGFHSLGSGVNNVFTNNVANANPQEGFHIAGNGNQLFDNRADENGLKGFALIGSDNLLVDGNRAVNNGQYGFYLQTADNNTARNNTAIGNYFGGYRLQSGGTGNVISSNQAINNGLNPCCRAGFQAALGVNNTGNNNTFTDNLAQGNGLGFQIAGEQGVNFNNVRANVLDGIKMEDANGARVVFNIIEDNSPNPIAGLRAGILVSNSNNNTFFGNVIRNNETYGILVRSTSTGNAFRNNSITSNPVAGVAVSGLTATENTFSNNFFNNGTNVSVPDNVPNAWNTGQLPITNIIHGPFLGGNFHGKPDGTGYSQTCVDSDGDGLCDLPLVLSNLNIDQLPLKDIIPPVVTPPADATVEAAETQGTSSSHPDILAFLASGSALDDLDGARSVSHDAPAVFPLGYTTVIFSATDLSGNTGQASAVVSVVDTTPPSLLLPQPLMVAAENEAGTRITDLDITTFLGTATATDTVDGPLPVSNNAPAVFPIRRTEVIFTVKDRSDNVASGSSFVDVIEDGDGIHRIIDGQIIDGEFIDESRVPSNKFTDGHLPNPAKPVGTFGTFTIRGDLTLSLADLPNPEGVEITAGAGTGEAIFRICSQSVRLTKGDTLRATCGSLITEVVVGPVEVLSVDGATEASLTDGTTAEVTETDTGDLEIVLDESTMVTMPNGTSATVSETTIGEITVVNDSAPNAPPILVEVAGTEITVEPGEEAVAHPRGLKRLAIGRIRPYIARSALIDEAISDIEASLEPHWWRDDFHLDPEGGEAVFGQEKEAIKRLLELKESKYGTGDSPEDSKENDSNVGNQVSPEALASAQLAINALLEADRILSQVAISAAEAGITQDPERQDKIDKELEKAKEELTRGDQDRDNDKPDNAIDGYRKAWEHAYKAMKEQMPLPGQDDVDNGE